MDSNLARARASILWLLALGCAFGSVWWIERESGRELIAAPSQPQPARAAAPVPQLSPSRGIPAEPVPRALTPQEQQWAVIAWSYFQRNLDPQTGLVRSVDGFPAATMWDTGSYLLALLAARDLDVIDAREFDLRMAKALVSLEQLPLYAGKLPNKSYDTGSLAMTDYRDRATASGIGWSAIDIGRLLVPLTAVVWQHPVHTPGVRRVLARWNLEALARGGELFGFEPAGKGQPHAVQEGRLGYEQYAAHTFALMGLDVETAADWRNHLQQVSVDDVPVCADDRDAQHFGALDAVVSEPYVLAGLEFGWTSSARECAWRAYRAQEVHWRRTGVLTAVSEDHVDQVPYFVYDTIWANGHAWATLTEQGAQVPQLHTLSVKACFGWDALLRTDYTAKLVQRVASLNDPAKGWYAGLYAQDGRPNRALTANTNAVVLESLAYVRRGRLLQYR
jgi:hypothetical protein